METAREGNEQMDPIPNLMAAARAGNINGLYEAIKEKPTLLKEIDEIPFVNTPFHEAASAGQTDFALEMIILAPSFGRKLNPDGLSPLDLAVIENHYETVKRLVRFDGELVRVKGKDGLTPLHRAAESDDRVRCLIELLLACPASVEDLTIRDETALHVAMKSSSSTIRDETALHVAMKSSSSAEAFQILYEWVSRAGDKQLLRKKDAKGNSAEAYHNKLQPQAVKKSLQVVKVEKPSHANADHDTQDMYNYLRTPERFYERQVRKVLAFMLWSQRGLTMEMRNVVLVVAVLIATASFEEIFSPPKEEQGSLAIDANSTLFQNTSGSFAPAFSNVDPFDFKKSRYKNFYILNTVAFFASVGVIIIVLPLRAYTSLLHLSLIVLVAYYFSAWNDQITAVRNGYNIGSSIYLFFPYYIKILFWTIACRKPDLLAILLLSPCLKQNFRCLQQMGFLTLK